MATLSLTPLKNALSTLKDGFKTNPSDLERDGLIQRFEYTLELSWKTAKRVLQENGIEVDIPKSIFRELAKAGWVSSAEPWIEFINARNKTSHIYHKEIAEEVFAVIPSFIDEVEKLVIVLEAKIQ